MTLTQAQCIKRGYFKKPIVAISKVQPVIPQKPRDWIWAATPYFSGGRFNAHDIGHEILAACMLHFRISVNEIKSHRRTQIEKNARHTFCYLARELTKLSFPQIGKLIDRDHSTVFHAAKVASRTPEIMEAVNQIKAGLVKTGL